MSKSTIYRFAIVLVAVLSMLVILQCSDDNPQGPDDTTTYSFGFSAALSDDGVALTWNSAENEGINGYHLYRSESATTGFSLIETFDPDSCAYVDDDVTAAITYYYFVTLYNSSGVDVDSSDVQYVTVTGGSIDISMNSWSASWLGDTSTQITVENGGNFATFTWEVVETADWLHVEPTSGVAPGNFTITVDSNLTAESRPASVRVTATGLSYAEITVNQLAAFETPVYYNAGTAPTAICAIDFDMDGDADLAVTHFYSYDVWLFENQGSGSFVSAGSFDVMDYPSDLTAADFDGDGDQDLVVESTVYFNNGSGTFSNATTYTVEDIPMGVRAADLDGDGDIDFVTSNNQGSVAVLLNTGDGTFNAPVVYTTALRSNSLCIADLNGDGNYDLATANDNSDNLSVLVGNGDGTFLPSVNYAVGEDPGSITAADIDGDGDQDLMVSNSDARTLSILRNNGDASFASREILAIDGDPKVIVQLDVDDDSDIDVCVKVSASGGYMAVLRNNGNGTFADPIFFAVDLGGSAQAVDFDGDGDEDIAATCSDYNGRISIMLNTR